MLAYRSNFAPDDANVVPLARDKAKRDTEIIRLWDAKWSARKIAEYLGIRTWTVGNVVHKNGRARNPTGPRKITVSIQDAPVETWQQAMLPELEGASDAIGAADDLKRAFVFACLLRLKRYDNMPTFVDWAHQVTGYAKAEIAGFIQCGIDGFLIYDGQPNPEAFQCAETVEGGGDIALILIAAVFEGTFERDGEGRFSIAGQPTGADIERWESEGGRLELAA
jgi:hypothetical protein